MAFTEQGVAMLSSVLKSKNAISVNIQVMRIFSRLRKVLETHSEIFRQLKELKENDIEPEQKFEIIFEYIKRMDEKNSDEEKFRERRRIGY